MTNSTILKRTMPATALLGVLALAGCAGGNVGSSWQCPLVQGGNCDSVAAADPAVPGAIAEPGAAREPVLRGPLYRVRGRAEIGTAPCRSDCGGFDPFGWLARLFGGEAGTRLEGRGRSGAGASGGYAAGPADPAQQSIVPPPNIGTAASSRGLPPESEPASAALWAEAGPGEAARGGGDLRTEELVGRIWIAPFVDANGVYREAFHVRAVLEPAGWRLR